MATARDLCPRCGWYDHVIRDRDGRVVADSSDRDCRPDCGALADQLFRAVPDAESTKLGYGTGHVALGLRGRLTVQLGVSPEGFRVDRIWILRSLLLDDAADLARTLVAWHRRCAEEVVGGVDREDDVEQSRGSSAGEGRVGRSARDRAVCPRCGWYEHAIRDREGRVVADFSDMECRPERGALADRLFRAVPEVESARLGYGTGHVAFGVLARSELTIHLRVLSDGFRVNDVGIPRELALGDAAGLAREFIAWHRRCEDRSGRADGPDASPGVG